MKSLFLALFSFLMVQVCLAQTAPKTKTKSADEAQFTPPVIKKNKPAKKKPAAQFTPPVIVKDKS